MFSRRGRRRTISGKLTIVPTPIGNLGDITIRALEALREADAIYAEDTRVTQKLLRALDVPSHSRVFRLDENTMSQHAPEVVELVGSGRLVAYCSDAGMPGVSDPGLKLVSLCRDRGLDVEVLPGPSAAVTAYVASGASSQCFYFGGFLPRKDAGRRAVLESLSGLDAALVFYESPHRLARSLAVVAEVFPQRRVTICRELTKLHEEVASGPADEVAVQFAERAESSQVKGECVIVIDSPGKDDAADFGVPAADARGLASRLLEEGVSRKDAAKTVASECGIPRNEAYDIVLSLKDACDG